jgi:hypothetical protein
MDALMQAYPLQNILPDKLFITTSLQNRASATIYQCAVAH